MGKYICIDIGGTAIKYGLVSEEGEMLEALERPSQADRGGPQLVTNVREILDAYLKETGQIYRTAPDRDKISIPDWDGKEGVCAGICISTAGMVDPISGCVFHSGPTIPDYRGTCWK